MFYFDTETQTPPIDLVRRTFSIAWDSCLEICHKVHLTKPRTFPSATEVFHSKAHATRYYASIPSAGPLEERIERSISLIESQEHIELVLSNPKVATVLEIQDLGTY